MDFTYDGNNLCSKYKRIEVKTEGNKVCGVPNLERVKGGKRRKTKRRKSKRRKSMKYFF